jgi:adenosylcobinamide-GDP ribazoletransferase
VDVRSNDVPANEFITDIARATGFLSRIPVADRYFRDFDGSLSRAVRAFPVAGFLICLPPAAVFALALALGQQPLIAAFLALAAHTLITGALHEDGLADSADGLGGARDREKALLIMRDSRIGSYGAVALILSFGIRASALSAIGSLMLPGPAGFAYAALGALSRAALVWHWSQLPPARTDGVAVASGAPAAEQVPVSLALGGAIAGAILWYCGSLLLALLTLSATAVATVAFTSRIRTRLGGHTGDTIGATQQISEMAALATLAVFLRITT